MKPTREESKEVRSKGMIGLNDVEQSDEMLHVMSTARTKSRFTTIRDTVIKTALATALLVAPMQLVGAGIASADDGEGDTPKVEVSADKKDDAKGDKKDKDKDKDKDSDKGEAQDTGLTSTMNQTINGVLGVYFDRYSNDDSFEINLTNADVKKLLAAVEDTSTATQMASGGGQIVLTPDNEMFIMPTNPKEDQYLAIYVGRFIDGSYVAASEGDVFTFTSDKGEKIARGEYEMKPMDDNEASDTEKETETDDKDTVGAVDKDKVDASPGDGNASETPTDDGTTVLDNGEVMFQDFEGGSELPQTNQTLNMYIVFSGLAMVLLSILLATSRNKLLLSLGLSEKGNDSK